MAYVLCSVMESFQFEVLEKALNKKKLHYIDPDLLSKNELLVIAAEISTSFMPSTNDSSFDNTLQLSQYSFQYISHCCSVLRNRKHKIQHAIKTHDEEDKQLNLKIAKLK